MSLLEWESSLDSTVIKLASNSARLSFSFIAASCSNEGELVAKNLSSISFIALVFVPSTRPYSITLEILRLKSSFLFSFGLLS